jgi:hypothetical protein
VLAGFVLVLSFYHLSGPVPTPDEEEP